MYTRTSSLEFLLVLLHKCIPPLTRFCYL